jgi:hypothetical protein
MHRPLLTGTLIDLTIAHGRGSEARPSAIKMLFNLCAGPRGLCGDPRIFDDLKKGRRSSATPAAALRYKTKGLSVATRPFHSYLFIAVENNVLDRSQNVFLVQRYLVLPCGDHRLQPGSSTPEMFKARLA